MKRSSHDGEVHGRLKGSRDLLILENAVENTNEAFVTIGEDHRVLFFNRAAEEIFGYGRDEVIGKDLNVIMSPRCSRDHRKAVDRYIATRVPTRIGHTTEMTAVRKTGETFPASISFSVAEVQKKLYFTGIVQDLTEAKAAQERVMRSERLAALGRAVAEITHEIKNPLMLIGGFARQILQEAGEGKSRKKLQIIEEEVIRLENLLADLTEFYRLGGLSMEEIDIVPLVQEVYNLVKDDCEKKNILVTFDRNKESIPIKGDKNRLKQVFLNLVKNAMEAIQDGGNISIKTQETGDLVKITIADDGCGIPKESQERVFSPFFTTKQQGTGLGLSISKNIIDLHEGSTIFLKSGPEMGTQFEIAIPLSRVGKEDSEREKGRGDR